MSGPDLFSSQREREPLEMAAIRADAGRDEIKAMLLTLAIVRRRSWRCSTAWSWRWGAGGGAGVHDVLTWHAAEALGSAQRGRLRAGAAPERRDDARRDRDPRAAAHGVGDGLGQRRAQA